MISVVVLYPHMFYVQSLSEIKCKFCSKVNGASGNEMRIIKSVYLTLIQIEFHSDFSICPCIALL